MRKCSLQSSVYPGITQFRLEWLFKFNSIGVGNMVQRIKTLATKPNDSSPMPRSQIEGRKVLLYVPLQHTKLINMLGNTNGPGKSGTRL